MAFFRLYNKDNSKSKSELPIKKNYQAFVNDLCHFASQ